MKRGRPFAATWNAAAKYCRLVRSKVWPRVSKAAKGVTWVAGLGAAILVIFNWLPPVYEHFNWRQIEYDLLDRVRAGNHSAYVDSVLGQPAVVKTFDHAPGLTENIYLRRDHYVMTVVDEGQRVVLYSVLSCSPDFSPSFRTPLGSQMRLQSVPLAEAETSPANPEADAELNDRTVTYIPALTVSSPGQFIETGVVSGANQARAQSWFVGVNSACGDTDGFGSEHPIGPFLSDLPEEARMHRQHVAANFYAETASGVEVWLHESGNLVFGSNEDPEHGYTGILVSPFHFDLPTPNYSRESTRRF